MMKDIWLQTALLLVAWPGVASAQVERPADASSAHALSLAEAVSLSVQRSLDVTLAETGVRQSAARERQDRADLLPSLSIGASYFNRSMNLHTFGLEFPRDPSTPPLPDLIGPFQVGDARAVLHQTLVDFAARARLRADRSEVHVHQTARGIAAERAAAAAAQAYLRAARAQAVLAARTRDVELAVRLADLAQAQLEAGVGTGIDVTRARTQLAAARGEALIARNDAERTQMELARSLSLDPSQRFAITDTLHPNLGVSDAPLAAESALGLARMRRPELAVERAELRHAGLEVSAIRAERLPRIGLMGDWGVTGTTWGNALATHQVGIEISLPLFDGMRRDARIDEQEATMASARTREEQLEIDLANEVQGALIDLGSADELERVAAERLSLAEQEVSEAQERFQRGVAGNVELITAQTSLGRARDAVIDARFAAAVARVRLARATGVATTVH